MAVAYSNNASTTLSATITNSVTSLSVATGDGAEFPSTAGGDHFYITLTNNAGDIEIMKVTARSTDTFTVVRGQDGTSARGWAAGDRIELRLTKAMLDDLKSERALSSHTHAAADITSGTLDNARVNWAAPGTIGSTTPNTGTFTSLTATSATSATITAEGDAITNFTATRSSTDNTGPTLQLRKARGTTASRTAVASGDAIGGVVMGAYGGTNFRNLTTIRGIVDTYTSDSDISAYLNFLTTPAGSVTAVERMRLDPSGTLLLRQTSNAANTSVSFNTTVQNALTLDSAGNFGVGVAPSYKLHVYGGAVTNPTNIFSQGYVANLAADTRCATIRNSFDSNTDWGTYWTSWRGANGGSYQSIFGVRTSGTDTDVLFLNNSGQVGIGTNSPNSLLEAYSTSESLVTSHSNSFATSGHGFGVYRSYTGQRLAGYTWKISSVIQNGGNSASTYQIDNITFNVRQTTTSGSLAEVMRITPSGDVGINSTAVRSKLDVLSGTANVNGDVANGINVTAANATITSNNVNVSINTNDAPAADVGGSIGLGGLYRTNVRDNTSYAIIKGAKENGTNENYGGYLAFATRVHGGNNIERMRIDSSGSVGIGTSSPQSKFAVSNGGAAGLEFFANYPGGGVGTYIQSYNRLSPGYIDIAYYAKSHKFWSNGVDNSLVIDSSGNVGIGTSSPSVKLQIYDATSSELIVQGDSAVNIRSHRASADTTAPAFVGRKSRGTIASPAAVNSGDGTGLFQGQAWGGSNWRATGRIDHYVETYTSDTNISGGITFSTNGGTTFTTERLRIDSSGTLLLRQSSNAANTSVSLNTTVQNALTLDSSGNVGIGTSSPGSLLQLTKVDGVYLTVGHSNWSTKHYAGIGGIVADGNNNTAGSLLFYTRENTTDASLTERARIDRFGNVGIGISPAARLHAAYQGGGTGDKEVLLLGAQNPYLSFEYPGVTAELARIHAVDVAGNKGKLEFWTQSGGSSADATRRVVIDESGNLLVRNNSGSFGDLSSYYLGTVLLNAGGFYSTVSSAPVAAFRRRTDDGDMVSFVNDSGSVVGTVSISGGTTSYNAFAGSHWSQLQDGSKPEILRGTVLESIDKLCEWEGEDNERLPKCKISDTAGSKKVYGVFMAWDNDWTATNDMFVTAVGSFICRVNGSVTVQEGDLLESNGDGTARVQADDIIRSSTIGKVVSTVKTYEYADGSYCVPTVLYCG